MAFVQSSFLTGAGSLQARRHDSARSARVAPLVVEAKESRIGKQPVKFPKGVEYKLTGQHLVVKGPKGSLERSFPVEMDIKEEDGALRMYKRNDTRSARQLHGLCRSLANNMALGVSEGFEKKLKLVGVGYKASMEGKTLVLSLGKSHLDKVPLPEGIEASVDGGVNISISGIDKEKVGNFAANIRALRKPEPYKGKGVRYADEYVALREGKR
mmetsp:Transcript_18723/g.61129  ORF Transcript_18723/g.61129 Transcript_18723/m.61129 type:complete len:213 (+) Transcript_18723:37-675(+)